MQIQILYLILFIQMNHAFQIGNFDPNQFTGRAKSSRSSSSSSLSLHAIANEFAPIFDPSIAIVCISILSSLSYMQLKLNENINIKKNIRELEATIKNYKIQQLSGDYDKMDLDNSLKQLDDLKIKEINTNTFLSFNGIQFNFRTSNVNKKIDNNDLIIKNEKDVSVDQQNIRIVVSVITVIFLSYILVMLSSDPMSIK